MAIDDLYRNLSDDEKVAVSRLRSNFDAEVNSGVKPNIEDSIHGMEREPKLALLAQLLDLEIQSHKDDKGRLLTLHELLSKHPNIQDDIYAVYGSLDLELRVPDRIDKYVIQKILSSSGGQGTVALARDSKTGKQVAIKFTFKPEQLDYLFNEGELLDNMRCRSIVSCLAFAKRRNFVFVVMPYLKGGNLSEVKITEWFKVFRIARIARQLAGALGYLHRRKIVHRDIKPDNIVVSRWESACLIDLGYALDLDNGAFKSIPITQHNGTPGYMSPEQESRKEKVSGIPSDIYAAGGVLYYLLTGKDPPPVVEQKPGIWVREESLHQNLEFLSPWSSKRLKKICKKAMDHDPGQRYRSAFRLKIALLLVEVTSILPWAVGILALTSACLFFLPRSADNTLSKSASLTSQRNAANVSATPIHSRLKQIAVDQNIDLSQLSPSDFSVSIESEKRKFRSWEIRPSADSKRGKLIISVENRLIDIAGSLAYRVGTRGWQGLYQRTDKGLNHRYAILDARDVELDGPLELRLGGESIQEGNFIVGPFRYDLSIQQEIVNDEKQVLKEHIAAAASADCFDLHQRG